jgi:hypothetical protein
VTLEGSQNCSAGHIEQKRFTVGRTRHKHFAIVAEGSAVRDIMETRDSTLHFVGLSIMNKYLRPESGNGAPVAHHKKNSLELMR